MRSAAALGLVALGVLGAGAAAADTHVYAPFDCTIYGTNQDESPAYMGYLATTRAANPHAGARWMTCPILREASPFKNQLSEIEVVVADQTTDGQVGCYAYAYDAGTGVSYYSSSDSTTVPGTQSNWPLALGSVSVSVNATAVVICYLSPSPGALSLPGLNAVVAYSVTQ